MKTGSHFSSLNAVYIVLRPSGRFHLCASRGRLDCLEVIISHGADVSVADGAGRVLVGRCVSGLVSSVVRNGL